MYEIRRSLFALAVVAVVALCACGDREPSSPGSAPEATTPQVALAGDGTVTFSSWSGKPRSLGSLATPDEDGQYSVLAGLKDALLEANRNRQDGWRGDVGRLPLLVTADPRAPWRHVNWLLSLATDEKVQAHVHLAELNGQPPVEISADDDPEHGGPSTSFVPFVSVKISRLHADEPLLAVTTIRWGLKVFTIPPFPAGSRIASPEGKRWEVDRESEFVRFEAELAAPHAHDPSVEGYVDAPPPSGGDVPFGDVLRLLRAFRTSGFPPVMFGRLPPPVTSAKHR